MNEGFSQAASTRVSNLLGEGRGRLARGAMGVCLTLVLSADVVCSGGLAALSEPWVRLFTEDERVVESAVDAMPWLVASVVIDGCVGAVWNRQGCIIEHPIRHEIAR